MRYRGKHVGEQFLLAASRNWRFHGDRDRKALRHQDNLAKTQPADGELEKADLPSNLATRWARIKAGLANMPTRVATGLRRLKARGRTVFKGEIAPLVVGADRQDASDQDGDCDVRREEKRRPTPRPKSGINSNVYDTGNSSPARPALLGILVAFSRPHASKPLPA